MNFELSEEQKLLQDSVARFVRDNYELEKRSKLVATKQGFSDDYWKAMAELGWLSLPFAEAQGGFGGNQIDTMVVMEQLGKGLVLEPFFASAVLGAGVLMALELVFSTWTKYWQLLLGAFIIGVVLFLPGGLGSLFERRRNRGEEHG